VEVWREEGGAMRVGEERRRWERCGEGGEIVEEEGGKSDGRDGGRRSGRELGG